MEINFFSKIVIIFFLRWGSVLHFMRLVRAKAKHSCTTKEAAVSRWKLEIERGFFFGRNELSASVEECTCKSQKFFLQRTKAAFEEVEKLAGRDTWRGSMQQEWPINVRSRNREVTLPKWQIYIKISGAVKNELNPKYFTINSGFLRVGGIAFITAKQSATSRSEKATGWNAFHCLLHFPLIYWGSEKFLNVNRKEIWDF